MRKAPEDPELTMSLKAKLFLSTYWRGVIIVITPLILIPVLVPFPSTKYQWTSYCLLLMAIYWVTECIPLAVTSFFPVVIFPLTDVSNTRDVCTSYMNDSVMMFIGSLVMAYSVEQSGLHKRLAYFVIQSIGYSHFKLLLAMCTVTTFVSMWITNTAATTMMVPINFALLKVFEDQGALTMYDVSPEGEKSASDVMSCYFCAATFSATIGGIGTLVGTGTNLAFKGLFVETYPKAPEYLSFPLFSAFSTPYMFVLEVLLYFYLIYVYFGFLRPNGHTARTTKIPLVAQLAAKAAIEADVKKKGKISYWEMMVVLLFGGAMIAFFCRCPQIFYGWGDRIHQYFGIEDGKYGLRKWVRFPHDTKTLYDEYKLCVNLGVSYVYNVRDSALAMFVSFWMLLLPRSADFWKNFTAKFHEDLPKTRQHSVLDWKVLNSLMPFSFSFLLGGGFALSDAAKSSGLNAKLGEQMGVLKNMPNPGIILIIILVVIFITNFASNVAVANVFCPIAMQLAKEIDKNPLWYCMTAGFTASYCFMIPVGTPGNLIVQSAAAVPTKKMIVAGFGPTISTIVITWAAFVFWAPVIWSDLPTLPEWALQSN